MMLLLWELGLLVSASLMVNEQHVTTAQIKSR